MCITLAERGSGGGSDPPLFKRERPFLPASKSAKTALAVLSMLWSVHVNIYARVSQYVCMYMSAHSSQATANWPTVASCC